MEHSRGSKGCADSCCQPDGFSVIPSRVDNPRSRIPKQEMRICNDRPPISLNLGSREANNISCPITTVHLPDAGSFSVIGTFDEEGGGIPLTGLTDWVKISSPVG